VDQEWTANGALVDLPLPDPFKKRPNFGARILVRSHVRKFWKALYAEIKDNKIENKRISANLCLMGVVFTEVITYFIIYILIIKKFQKKQIFNYHL